tara:strand:+ start:24455 stop:24727 length:273 start_codon:yes stop_codon:yes gene_type:complete
MKAGKEYLVGLETAPSIEPKEGGWALVQYENGGSTAVSPVVSTKSPWAKSVHVFALANGKNPTLGEDYLSYRNEEGDGERRVIVSFVQLN